MVSGPIQISNERWVRTLIEDLVALRVVETAVLPEVDVAVVCGPASLKLAGRQCVEVVVDARVEAGQDQSGAVRLIGVGGDVCRAC